MVDKVLLRLDALKRGIFVSVILCLLIGIVVGYGVEMVARRLKKIYRDREIYD